jgi:serine/threonine protein kinase
MDRNSTFLLDDGDELRLSETVTLVYHPMNAVKEIALSHIQDRERRAFAARYLVTGRLLGQGAFGRVVVGTHQDTQRQLACKIVRLDHLYDKPTLPKLRVPTGGRNERARGSKKRWPTKVANCFREFDILQDLSHPNIIAIEKVFWSHNTIYIFQDLVTGGDLFSYVEFKGGHLDELQAAHVIYQVLKGVEYLHREDIVHRDLKPDNMLMSSLQDNARVVITDFGAARFLPEATSSSALAANKYQRMFSLVGTLDFAAPEIHKANRYIPAEDGYSKSIDMWSIGSITATILTGEMLFTHRDDSDYHADAQAAIIGRAALCDLSVLDEEYHPRWSKMNDTTKDFIRGLLVLAEDARMTAPEALSHSWFSSFHVDSEEAYRRLVADWEPRTNQEQLVERVSMPAPNPTTAACSIRSYSRVLSSRFFPQTGAEFPQHGLPRTESRRDNTALPSIDRQRRYTGWMQTRSRSTKLPSEDGSQPFISDIIAPYEEQLGGANHGYDEYSNELFTPQADYSPNYEYWPMKEPDIECLASVSMQQAITEDHHFPGSGESLNNTKNSYSQPGHCGRFPTLQTTHGAPDSVQVFETPLAEQIEFAQRSHNHQQTDDSYQQTQIPCKTRQYMSAGEQQSVIVCETPPEVFSKRPRSSEDGLSAYQTWSNSVELHHDAGSRRKRGKLSRCPH